MSIAGTSNLSTVFATRGTPGFLGILRPPLFWCFSFQLPGSPGSSTTLKDFLNHTCLLNHACHRELFHQLAPEFWAPCFPTCQNNGGPHPQPLLVSKVLASQWQLSSGWDLTKPYLWHLWGHVTYARYVLKADILSIFRISIIISVMEHHDQKQPGKTGGVFRRILPCNCLSLRKS